MGHVAVVLGRDLVALDTGSVGGNTVALAVGRVLANTRVVVDQGQEQGMGWHWSAESRPAVEQLGLDIEPLAGVQRLEFAHQR